MKITNKTKKSLNFRVWDNTGEECPFFDFSLYSGDTSIEISKYTYLIEITEVDIIERKKETVK